VSYDYDPAGNLIKVTDPKGAAVEYDYYDNGWLKTGASLTGTKI
jgi:YD repeat-containing protein